MLRDTHHGKTCPYCLRTMDRGNARLQPTRDHVIPACHGGRTKIICCITCNGIKADMLPLIWEAFMEANPGWWKLSKRELRVRRRANLGFRPAPRPRRRIRYLQGTAPASPVTVPPPLIYTTAAATAQPERKTP